MANGLLQTYGYGEKPGQELTFTGADIAGMPISLPPPVSQPTMPIEQVSGQSPSLGSRAMGILGSIGGALGDIGGAAGRGLVNLGGGVQQFFQDRPDLLDTLSIGFGGMSMRPNEGLIDLAKARIAQREVDRQEQAAANRAAEELRATANRTVEYFRSIGRNDLAQSIEANPELAQPVVEAYISSTLEPPPEQFIPLSAEQAASLGLPEGSYQVSTTTGKISSIGRSGDTYVIGDQMREFGYEYLSEQYKNIQERAANSQAVLDDVDLITNLIETSDLSNMERIVASRYPEFSNLLRQGDGKIAAARAIINARAPQFRVEGSGATSDRDMAMYIQALPAFTASLEGNKLTLEIFRAKAKKDAEASKVSNDWATQKISDTEALNALNKLNTESLFTPEFRRKITNIYPKFFEQQASSQNTSVGVTFTRVP